MQISFSIPSSSVEETRQMLNDEKKGDVVELNAVCYAQVVFTASNGTDTLTLDEAPFLFLMEDLKTFLTRSASESHAKHQSSGFDQEYTLYLAKEVNVLTMSSYRGGKTIRVAFPRKGDELDVVVAKFLKAYLRLCPELAKYSQMDTIRRTFNVPA